MFINYKLLHFFLRFYQRRSNPHRATAPQHTSNYNYDSFKYCSCSREFAVRLSLQPCNLKSRIVMTEIIKVITQWKKAADDVFWLRNSTITNIWKQFFLHIGNEGGIFSIFPTPSSPTRSTVSRKPDALAKQTLRGIRLSQKLFKNLVSEVMPSCWVENTWLDTVIIFKLCQCFDFLANF